MKLEIKIDFSTGSITKEIDYPSQHQIEIDFHRVRQPILVKALTINGLPANQYYNTSYKNKKGITKTSIHSIEDDGTYILSINDTYVKGLRSGYWNVSTYHDDYIFTYQLVNNSFTDVYGDRDHVGFDKSFVPCFGCSYTYGAAQKNTQAWPNLLSHKTKHNYLNLGVCGAGIDTVANNLLKLHDQKNFKQCIILVPHFARRILEQKVENLHVRIPNLVEIPKNKFSYLSHLAQEKKRIEQLIVKDLNDDYSKQKLQDIIEFCNIKNIELYMTSHHDDVYTFLQSQKVNTLPKFPKLTMFEERAGDGMHPHEKHYQYFVDSIVDFL